jgi:hypothetical protein
MLSRITLATIRCIVVLMMTVVVVVVVTMVVVFIIVVMMSVTAGSMAAVARRVSVDEKMREDAGRRPVGDADQRHEREQKHHRPDQGDVASARSFQLRQHRSRSLAVAIASGEATGHRQQGLAS